MSPASLRLGAAFALVSLGGLIASAQAPRVPAAGPSRVDFTQQIRPLLSDRCFRCHGPDPGKRKAKLRLDTREGAFKPIENGWFIVKPFEPGRSEVVRRTSSRDPDEMMPPPESRLTLSDTEQALMARWVAEGADYKPHWSLVPVTAVQPPATAPRSSHPIDAFVRARLERQGMAPAPAASREVLIRRLAFNLTGLPPTLDEIDAFLADRSPEAYTRVVDRYLASPAYGERMAVDWLDLARYADTYGYQADVERDMSPYRDWVIRAFNANLPYREFLTWQLAGDLLPSPTRDQRVATAFNRLHRQTNEGGSIEEEFRAEYVVDRVNTFGTAMLGLTVECARCHDHKFDPITQRDYYSLFAFFNSIDESGLYSHFTGATPSPSLLLWPDQTARDQQVLLEQIAAAEGERRRLASLARRAFQSWLPGARIAPATPISRLAFDQVSGDTTPDAVLRVPAQLKDEPALERDGASTTALRFSGDNAVVIPGVRAFGRTDRFSVSLRLKPAVAQDRAIVLHQSRAWTDAGSRGFELTLDHGRPFFGLIHFWPGNAVAIRSRTPLPLGAWSRLVITYDGSSRAGGIRLFLNGAPLASDVVRDRLFKDIIYDKARGDNVTEQPPFTVGARFRDSGFKNGLIDDLQIFDVELTEAEVLALEHRAAPPAALFRHFLARQHEPSRAVQRQLDALRRSENALVATVPEIMVMEEMRTARPAHVLRRGSYDAPGPVVGRNTPAALPPLPPNAPRNRLGLAQWLTARQHPLTARVAVNRIWRMHFGRGLVATQEDFGSQGRLPTHPELLDWLADRFMASGWDVKALHRLIVSSAVFQQSSRVSTETLANDPDNLRLSRGPKVRLSAESIRDSALAASGLLNRAIGGPSVKPYQPAGLWEQSGTGKTYTQDTGGKLYRRSLYTFWRRTSPPPSMLAFDAMSREVCTAKRDPTVTPLQSLVLLNDPQFVEAARALAQRVLTTYVGDKVMRNREAFRALIGRAPDGQEAAILARLFDEQRTLFEARLDDAERLLAIGESARDMTLPAADFAAMTSVVSAIMNFDEFVVVR